MRKFILSLSLSGVLGVAALSLSACSNFTQVASAPAPLTTLKQVTDLSNLAESGADTYVRVAHPSLAQAEALQKLRGTLRATIDALAQAHAQGLPLDFTAFSAALAALNTFTGANAPSSTAAVAAASSN